MKLNLALLGDSQLNPQVSATVARQMVANKKILGMVGFAGSNENLGGGPVLDGAKLPYVTGSATQGHSGDRRNGPEAAEVLLPRRSDQLDAGEGRRRLHRPEAQAEQGLRRS